jgi:aminoglycoside 6'-N-acetyltransferase I
VSVRIVPFETLGAAQQAQAAQVLVHAFAHAPAAWRTITEATAEVAKFYDDPDRSALAALHAAQVIGWIGMIRDYSHAFQLHPIAVDPAWQRRGVGAQLVQALEAAARKEGALTLCLGTDDDFGGTTLFGADPLPDLLASLGAVQQSPRGHPVGFYLKLGFKLSGIVPDANGPGRPDILMAKRLT